MPFIIGPALALLGGALLGSAGRAAQQKREEKLAKEKAQLAQQTQMQRLLLQNPEILIGSFQDDPAATRALMGDVFGDQGAQLADLFAAQAQAPTGLERTLQTLRQQGIQIGNIPGVAGQAPTRGQPSAVRRLPAPAAQPRRGVTLPPGRRLPPGTQAQVGITEPRPAAPVQIPQAAAEAALAEQGIQVPVQAPMAPMPPQEAVPEVPQAATPTTQIESFQPATGRVSGISINAQGKATFSIDLSQKDQAVNFVNQQILRNPQLLDEALAEVTRQGISFKKADIAFIQDAATTRSMVVEYQNAISQGMDSVSAARQAAQRTLAELGGFANTEAVTRLQNTLQDPAQAAGAVTFAQERARAQAGLTPEAEALADAQARRGAEAAFQEGIAKEAVTATPTAEQADAIRTRRTVERERQIQEERLRVEAGLPQPGLPPAEAAARATERRGRVAQTRQAAQEGRVFNRFSGQQVVQNAPEADLLSQDTVTVSVVDQRNLTRVRTAAKNMVEIGDRLARVYGPGGLLEQVPSGVVARGAEAVRIWLSTRAQNDPDFIALQRELIPLVVSAGREITQEGSRGSDQDLAIWLGSGPQLGGTLSQAPDRKEVAFALYDRMLEALQRYTGSILLNDNFIMPQLPEPLSAGGKLRRADLVDREIARREALEGKK